MNGANDSAINRHSGDRVLRVTPFAKVRGPADCCIGIRLAGLRCAVHSRDCIEIAGFWISLRFSRRRMICWAGEAARNYWIHVHDGFGMIAKDRIALGLLAGWIALVSGAFAQTTVTIQPPRGDVYVNEPFEVSVQVQNFQECSEPGFPELPNCTIERALGGESTQTTIINGRMRTTRTRTYEYRITAGQAGELVIPPVKVVVDGKQLGTRPVRIDVLPSDAVDRLLIEITSEVPHAYVGQQVRLTLSIWIEPALFDGQQISAPGMYSCLQRGDVRPFSPPEADSAILKQRTAADGTKRSYYVFSSALAYVAERPGILNFPDIRVEAAYPTRIVRDVFRELRVASARTLRSAATGPGIEILPLPNEGRPANFSGAVGQFTLHASARPLQVRVGDPIELTIEIRGDGPLDTLPAPLLASDSQLTRSFRVPRETLTGETIAGVRRFKQMIRPVNPEIREIPAISYPYFDPVAGEYRVASSQPIPLAITGGESLEIAPDPALVEQAPDVEETTGLRGNETSIAALLRSESAVRVGHVLAAAVGPPVVISALWVVGAWMQTQRKARNARRFRAAAIAREKIAGVSRLPPRDAAHELLSMLANYLADRTEGSAAMFTGRAAVEFLRGRAVDSQILSEIAAFVDRCETIGFGGGAGGDTEELLLTARACIDQLERVNL